jgi:hypothetical protein
VHWKGAAEIILDSCTSWLDTDGSKHSMTPEKVIYRSLFKRGLHCHSSLHSMVLTY